MQKNLNVAMGAVRNYSKFPFHALFGNDSGNRAEYCCEADSLEQAIQECHDVVDKYPHTALGMGEPIHLCSISQTHSNGNSSVVYSEPELYQKPSYRGVPGTHYLWHGTQSDPEIFYNDEYFCYWSIEDDLWECFKEDTGFSKEDVWADSKFQSWIDQNHDTVIGMLEDLISVREGYCDVLD